MARRPVHRSAKVAKADLNHLDPVLRAEVLRMAGGDASRIKVISYREAVVH